MNTKSGLRIWGSIALALMMVEGAIVVYVGFTGDYLIGIPLIIIFAVPTYYANRKLDMYYERWLTDI